MQNFIAQSMRRAGLAPKNKGPVSNQSPTNKMAQNGTQNDPKWCLQAGRRKETASEQGKSLIFIGHASKIKGSSFPETHLKMSLQNTDKTSKIQPFA